ncbi:MAG: hypothetical protein J0J06_07230 [Sphingomonas sp.]|uniref:hypothetical protein n=1 Tax=Sphingomonas sp. TaxID=28214 RepID=UPI001AC9DBA3|nr:hypothetical protein [Sphingomonas sp.]MBN8815224.1 hypothetical protein [Sphingomonas sp.]
MNKLITALVAGATLVAGIAAIPAEAQRRGGSISVQGSAGRGGTLSRSVNRQPGSSTVTRGIQTNSGRGATTTRGGSWANGTYSGGKTTTLNNGTAFGRSTTATANGNGSGSFSSTVTGPGGQSGTVSGTVTKTPQ